MIFKKIECQYITVEGAQFGELYLSENYLMFKSSNKNLPEKYKFASKVRITCDHSNREINWSRRLIKSGR